MLDWLPIAVPPAPLFFAQLLVGLINGAFYAMLSLGLAVIFGLLNIINFTHGAQYMLGAFCAWFLLNWFGIGYWAALVIAPVVVGILGIAIERSALLQQIDRSMEEASASLGAGSLTTFRRVMLPLILPAFFAGLGVVFIRSMTAISATIFLVSINWTLITVKILENMTEVALGPAEGGVTAVREGVAAGDALIVDGADKVQERSRVEPTSRERPAARAGT